MAAEIHHCLWHTMGQRFCYAPATQVIVGLNGATLEFTCEEHLLRWGERVTIPFWTIKLEEWIELKSVRG